MSLHRPSFALLAAVSAVALWVPAAPAAAAGAVPEHTVVALLQSYQPSSEIHIDEGESILFVDADPTAGPGHTFTEDVPRGVTPRFDSGIVPPGTFKEVPDIASLAPGRYPVHCRIHVIVKGTLTVG